MIIAADAAHDRQERSRRNENGKPIADDGERRGDAKRGQQQHHDRHRDAGDKAGKQASG